MILRWFSVILCLFLSTAAQARKLAFIWGGGGENVYKADTQFDRDFLNIIGPLQNSGYEIRAAFGGTQPSTRKLVEKLLSLRESRIFTVNAVEEDIRFLKSEIANRKLSENDQVLFIILTHGDSPEETPKVKTHLVSTGQVGKLEKLNLDSLMDIRNDLEAKGVRLAILDFSCHSGSTIALATAHTCVASGSSAEELSFTSLLTSYARELRPGDNLESLFLKVRIADTSFESPEISSLPGSLIRVAEILNAGATNPVKLRQTTAALDRHLEYLKRVYGLDRTTVEEQIKNIFKQSEMTEMKSIRDSYQSMAQSEKGKSMSFDELEAQKGQALIRFYFQERNLFHRLYPQFQNLPAANPCRDFKL